MPITVHHFLGRSEKAWDVVEACYQTQNSTFPFLLPNRGSFLFHCRIIEKIKKKDKFRKKGSTYPVTRKIRLKSENFDSLQSTRLTTAAGSIQFVCSPSPL